MLGLSNLAKYPTIKKMRKTFREHPVYGYTIESWRFDAVIKYRDDGGHRTEITHRRGRGNRTESIA